MLNLVFWHLGCILQVLVYLCGCFFDLHCLRYMFSLFRWMVRKAIIFFIVFLILSVLWVCLYKWFNPPSTPLIVERQLSAIWHGSERVQAIRSWRNYEDMSPNLILSVIASEDQNFPFHDGFDLKAIERAVEHNQQQVGKKNPRIKGASTISQQVAKNVFLWESRSWVRKGFEVYFTFLIENLWSKRRILEMYLNVAEMGDLLFGAEAAAQTYFGKTATTLSLNESALLASCLPNPRRYNPLKPDAHILKRKNWTIKQVGKMGGKNFLDLIQ